MARAAVIGSNGPWALCRYRGLPTHECGCCTVNADEHQRYLRWKAAQSQQADPPNIIRGEN